MSAHGHARTETQELPRWTHGVLGAAALLLAWQGTVEFIYSGHGTIPSAVGPMINKRQQDSIATANTARVMLSAPDS